MTKKLLSSLTVLCTTFIITVVIIGVYRNSVILDKTELQLTNDSNALQLIDEQSKLIISLTIDKEEALIRVNELSIKLDELVVINNRLRITVNDKGEVVDDLEKELYFIRVIVNTLRDQIDSFKNEIRRLNNEITDLKIPLEGPK